MTKSPKFQSKVWCFIKEINLGEYPRPCHTLLFLISVIIHNFTQLAWGSTASRASKTHKPTELGFWSQMFPSALGTGGKLHIIRRMKHGQLEVELWSCFFPSGCFVPWRFAGLELPQCSTGIFQLIKNNNWRKGHLQGRRKMIQSTKLVV